ncbi:uncharacterized protein LOC109706053 [Ananas comosus]|uniref:Uncharacterized protein LOC109706053 n=1 Tax=Ananas comosus TaxID=4615 RepID=A0A6P5EGK1_ANACO|nr:uncharacterized protein LOC109706053 [Ananas comosus]
MSARRSFVPRQSETPRPAPSGRVFAAQAKEPVVVDDVVAGASHSFISSSFAKTHDIEISDSANAWWVYAPEHTFSVHEELSTLKARKLISSGCAAYLATVVETQKELPALGDILVVREFPDVFPAELPELPPDREIEFVIDLVPGTAPISKAPYRMAPAELRELKAQLQDLLDKGFAKPSDALGTRLDFSTEFHPQTDGQSERRIQILEDMLRACVLDFRGGWHDFLAMAEFTYNNSYQESIAMASFEALYGRKCRSPIHWSVVGERIVLGPDVLQEAEGKVRLVRQRLLTAQSRQQSYANKRRKNLEFAVGDRVFLKVLPMRGIKRFGVRGKLSPRYIGPYEILERVGAVAYKLALPPKFEGIHNVFHISNLRKYVHHPGHVLEYEPVDLQENMTYEEYPVCILDREVRELRNRAIPYVKVQRSNHLRREATWELEEAMRESYPHPLDLES